MLSNAHASRTPIFRPPWRPADPVGYPINDRSGEPDEVFHRELARLEAADEVRPWMYHHDYADPDAQAVQ